MGATKITYGKPPLKVKCATCVVHAAQENSNSKQLFALAKELGYVLSPLETIRKELSNSISTRFVTRTGVDICRAAAFNLLLITREAGIPSAVPACQTRLSLA